MALKGSRRPQVPQDNLRSLITHRQQGAFISAAGDASTASAGRRPPLPGSGYPPCSRAVESGRVPSSPSTAVPSLPPLPAGSRSGVACSPRASQELPKLGRPSSEPMEARLASDEGAPRSQRAVASRRSASAAAASSPQRGSKRISASPSASPRSDADSKGDEDEDEDFFLQLQELEALSSQLGLLPEEESMVQGFSSEQLRPTTGGTSASASTAVPGGSSSLASLGDGEATSADVDDAAASTANKPAKVSDELVDSLSGAIRAHHELQNFKLPHGCRIEDAIGSAAQFFFTIDVGEGPYTPASLTFWIKVFNEFPAPGSCSVRCTKKIFHPCVDPKTGRLEFAEDHLDSNGFLQLPAILLDIRRLIVAPVDSPAVNMDAALLLQTDPDEFRRTVRLTLGGGEYGGLSFDQLVGVGGKLAHDRRPSLEQTEGTLPQRPVPEKLKVEMMELEVMKNKFSAEVKAWQMENDIVVRELRSKMSKHAR